MLGERAEAIKRLIHPLAIFGLVASVYGLGLLDFVDFKLTDLQFRTITRPATSELVIVEIDSQSLKELDVWPWPRSHHARVIDILAGVGARQIAFDVDFSSRSSEEQDAALAAAIANADGRVILPAFSQAPLGTEDQARATRTDPLPIFARHSRLAAIEMSMESDGRVRRVSTEGRQGQDPLPSLFSVLAGSTAPEAESFSIDFGIAPGSIPRLSYVDVLMGRFDPRLVTGRSVLVGATAKELGDQIPVPVFGVLPGSMVQAMAYQSLAQGRTLARISVLPTLAAAALVVLLLFPLFRRWSWPIGLAVLAGFAVLLLAISFFVQSAFPLVLNLAPLFLAGGLSLAWAMAGRLTQQDLRILTQGLELRRKDAHLARVVENSFDAIITIDDADRITSFNPAACRIFGQEASEAIGGPVEGIMRDALCPATGTGLTESLKVCGGLYEIQGKSRVGEAVTVQAVVSRMEFNSERSRIVILRDVTELKKKEEALREALVDAQLADRCKSDFLANMSHELRTPLNAVIGFTEMMLQEINGPLGSPSYKEYAGAANRAGEQLLTTVDDLLNLSKINGGTYDLTEEPVEIAAIIRYCLESVQTQAEEAGVALTTEQPENALYLHGDERAVRQILLNLLSNAIKFTPEGGAVVLSCSAAEEGGMTLRVADTGIGIAPENIPQVLSDFGQVEGVYSREYDGAGLGLPLAVRLAELHGGTLALESDLGSGTVASVSFPAARVSWKEAKFRSFGR